MTSIRVLILGVVLFTYTTGSAQESDSLSKLITWSIARSISTGHDGIKCQGFRPTVFSMFVTFSERGKVEDVIFSESENCFTLNSERIRKLTKTNIDNLNLERSKTANTYILALISVVPYERTDTTSNKIPNDWDTLFKGVKFKSLKGRDLLLSVPIWMYLLPRIEN